MVASIPDDNSWNEETRRVEEQVRSLFSAYFTITDTGVEEQKFRYVYSVEGPWDATPCICTPWGACSPASSRPWQPR